jgi:glycosyltransferase involved in cell wall biosynthesis
MDILIAHNFYLQAGGEDECLAAEVEMLRAYGHNVIQYSVSNEILEGMGPLELASRTMWSKVACRELTELFQTHRPQIAHFHNTFPLISPAAYYAARRADVRVVQTLHNFRLLCANALFFRNGLVCEDCLGKPLGWPGIARRCYRESFTASSGIAAMTAMHRAIGTWQRAVDIYIALTEFARLKLVEGGLPADRIMVKPNFAYPDSGIGTGEGGYGLFVGRLSTEKGVDTLLGAWDRLDGGLPLKIVGDGPMCGAVAAAAARNPAIEWLGRVPREAVDVLMGDAALVIVPSNCYETFGRVIIEAYAKGTPVVASRLGAMAELVVDGQTGSHFRPGSSDDLACKIRELVLDAKRRAQMRQFARRAFERKYTRQQNYKSLISLYECALGSAPRTRSST